MRIKNIKKLIGVVTALIVAVSPMAVMAAEITNNISENEIETVMNEGYSDWFDEDISIYIPSIDSTLRGHLRFAYEYSDGSWAYISTNPIPAFTNLSVDDGNVEFDMLSSVPSYNTVRFSVAVSSNTAVRSI